MKFPPMDTYGPSFHLYWAVKDFIRDRYTCPTTNGKDLEAWEKMKRSIQELDEIWANFERDET